jgi:phytoene dehydrogenase-like protein
LFEEFFPGRDDVHRLLLEPIAYANGSTLDDPAITYGIVFSNFMNKGVYIFRGGTDLFIGLMAAELRKNGADVRHRCLVERILTEPGPDGRPRVRAVLVNGREIRCRAVLSNANIKNTLDELVGREHLPAAFCAEAAAVRVNTSSCQVYLGLRAGESIPPMGDLVFTSGAPRFTSDELTDFHTTSRTFSVYYPDTRPQREEPRYAVVASINARWEDWDKLDETEYARHKQRILEESLVALERFVPGVRAKIEWFEAATPRTVRRYVRHVGGTSFGTKFEGLKVSMELSDHVPGLYHAGSVGIIMSGWLGTINYGVITASKMDAYLSAARAGAVPAPPQTVAV